MYDDQYFIERDQLPLHMATTIELYLAAHRASDVLEVGAGTGQMMRFLRNKGYRVQGIDRSPIAARMAKGVVASATEIPFGDSLFDSVLAISVIEHLDRKDGERFVREARRALRPKGSLFIVTPNFSSPMRYVQGRNWFAYSDRTHITFYRPRELRQLLAAEGFDQIQGRFRTTGDAFDWVLPPALARLPSRMRSLMNHLLVTSPLALARDSIWMAGRKTAD